MPTIVPCAGALHNRAANQFAVLAGSRPTWSSLGRMDQDAIVQHVSETFAGTNIVRPTDGPGAGDTFFIYDPDRNLPDRQQIPFATIVTKDYGDFDNASHLDRPDVFRLNVGVSRHTFNRLFGPGSAAEGSEGSTPDFAALDRLMPHPTYASQSWVCVLNPSLATFDAIKPLLAEAYARAANRQAGRG